MAKDFLASFSVFAKRIAFVMNGHFSQRLYRKVCKVFFSRQLSPPTTALYSRCFLLSHTEWMKSKVNRDTTGETEKERENCVRRRQKVSAQRNYPKIFLSLNCAKMNTSAADAAFYKIKYTRHPPRTHCVSVFGREEMTKKKKLAIVSFVLFTQRKSRFGKRLNLCNLRILA